MTKKYITENIRTIDLDDMIHTDIDSFITMFAEIKKEYPNDKIAVSFNKHEKLDYNDYDTCYVCECTHTLDFTLNRIETDKEYDNRINRYKNQKKARQKAKEEKIEKKRLEKEANDKKEYLRLKKIYEGKP